MIIRVIGSLPFHKKADEIAMFESSCVSDHSYDEGLGEHIVLISILP